MKTMCRVCRTTVVDGECKCRETVEVVLGNVDSAVLGLIRRHGWWTVAKTLLAGPWRYREAIRIAKES